MKKSLHIILALSLGIMIGMVGTAFAAGEIVEATFAKFQYIINGEPTELEADALVYQGSTYLPVRVLLNTLGYDVTYLAENRTIKADKTVESLIDEAQKIGGEITVTPVEEMTLEEIENRIEVIKGVIRAYEISIAVAEETGPPRVIDDALAQIAKQQEKLAELEARKAELESQLQQLKK